MLKRKNSKIPLYSFNEHNKSFYYWQKARFEGILNSSVDLFHIDAHNDMNKPYRFRKSLYPPHGSDSLAYYEKFSYEELNIANFIFPAVLSGIVKNVYFFYPEWRNFKPAQARIQIGSVFGEGNLLKYPTWIASGRQKKTVDKALPDLKKFIYKASLIDRMPRNRKVILDIDLDYFACRDSVQNNWKYRLAITPEQYQQADSFLQDETIPFSGLEFRFELERQQPTVLISFQKSDDKAYLPDKKDIAKVVDLLTNTLISRSIRPVVITLSRSCISGYTPIEYVDYIENLLLKKLSGIYSLQIFNS